MSFYNVKLIEYADSCQVRLYKKAIIIKNDKERRKEDEKKNIEENEKEMETIVQTEEQKEHSQYVSSMRTKQKVYEICRANSWDWFVTFTFNRQKVDSSNYELLTKKVSQWLKDVKKEYAPNLKYLLIPELHKDGIHYHFHALFAEIGALDMVDSGVVHKGRVIYNVSRFKYGFTTATAVTDSNKVSSYIAKYITKDLLNKICGKKRYWTSRNLNKPRVTEFFMTKDEKLQMMIDLSSQITFMKTQAVPIIGQEINYLEMLK